MAIPSTAPRPWHTKRGWPARISLLLAVVAGTGSVYLEGSKAKASALQLVLLGVALLGAVALGLFRISEADYGDKKEAKATSPDELRGPLFALHSILAFLKGVDEPVDGWLRLTIHRLDGLELEQSVNYVGTTEHGRAAGRRFSIHEGLVGRVARAGRPLRFDRPGDMTDREWVDYLVEELAMTREAAKMTREQRYSFFGVPISNSAGDVSGVVYLDAAEPEFFDEDTMLIILSACEGLAEWIDTRYGT